MADDRTESLRALYQEMLDQIGSEANYGNFNLRPLTREHIEAFVERARLEIAADELRTKLDQRGTYLHPELFGEPTTQTVGLFAPTAAELPTRRLDAG